MGITAHDGHEVDADVTEPPRRPFWDRVRRWFPSVSWPSWVRRTAPIVSTVIAALAGAWLGLIVAGTSHATIGPLAVDAAVQPSWGGSTVIEVDPIGTLELATHGGPLTLQMSVRSVDIERFREIIDDPDALQNLDDRLVDDAQELLVQALVRGGIVAIIGAVVAGALVTRSGRRTLLAAGVGLTAVVAGYGTAAATFNPEAARQPTFTGVLATAPQVVGSVEDIATNFDVYAEQLAGIVTNAGALYEAALALPTYQPNDETIRVLHISDLHLNPAAWPVVDSVADQYDVDVIVDTGDIVDYGSGTEDGYVAPIASLGRPYIYVKGNHDSVGTAAAIAAQENTFVLDHEEVEVAGLRFYGAPDPRFTPDQSTRGTARDDILRGTEQVADEVRDLPEPPDVVAYHDPTHSTLFDEAAPLVLSGHMHTRNTYLLDGGTRVMVQGSSGGAGLRGLQNEEPTPVAMSVLFFNPESRDLVAWDDITLGGLGLSSAQIERHQADQEPSDGDEPAGDPDVDAVDPDEPGSVIDPDAPEDPADIIDPGETDPNETDPTQSDPTETGSPPPSPGP